MRRDSNATSLRVAMSGGGGGVGGDGDGQQQRKQQQQQQSSDRERSARSVALEQAYVHDVYEQCAGKTVQGKHWPRIYKFLEELEPGALVCDIGCGNGKYLSINDNVFKVGADRCKRLTAIAREKENEVMICDNLALPFRDESFDAVLSIAVVHHFATTERRVNALKELARVLRIGGRLVISVWAMEQRHRKFESQDVLVPWPKAYCLDTKTTDSGSLDVSSERIARVVSSSAGKSRTDQRCKNRGYWIDPIFSPSPSTSSLSSPNETCYSFFRRVLQKLAGGKRRNRAWFLETWQNGGMNKRRSDFEYYYDDGGGDVDDIPIELRRLEDDDATKDALLKSKSLGDILEIQRLDLVRSRSSIPGFSSNLTSEFNLESPISNWPETTNPVVPLVPVAAITTAATTVTTTTTTKPRLLVKQKTHLESPMEFNEQSHPEADESQVIAASQRPSRVHKQSSMNEELLSMERLLERDSVRKNIMKQASLNEEIICKPSGAEENADSSGNLGGWSGGSVTGSFCHFRESLYSGSATKRFQLMKSDLTNRIKQSTTSMESRVSGMGLRNGFVRILQGWKSGEDLSKSSDSPTANPAPGAPNTGNIHNNNNNANNNQGNRAAETIERRLSKEDGSDSSKDSSLQSDASVDSEDSFASVIYVPKRENSQQSQRKSSIENAKIPAYNQLRTCSAPPSPRIKNPPMGCGVQGSKLVSPLLKQFPATSKSLPPPSPPGLANALFFHPSERPELEKVEKSAVIEEKEEEKTLPEPAPTPITPEVVTGPLEKQRSSSSESLTEQDNSRRSRLNEIKELLKQKPGFATRSVKSSFPLVRRANSATSGGWSGRPEATRLLSLELFNPETDDLDSDSSGLSSPESVSSVISVISDKRFISKPEVSDKNLENEEEIVKNDEPSIISTNKKEGHAKYSQLVDDTIAWLSGSTASYESLETTEKSFILDVADENKSISEDFVMVTNNGEFFEPDCQGPAAGNSNGPTSSTSNSGNIVDGERTRFSNDETESLDTFYNNDSGISLDNFNNPNYKQRSNSEETNLEEEDDDDRRMHLSGSSSQDSLPSDRGDGAITYHQYYHVFREGELDQLIDKYVENLHIISSFYDHASWCIVAEKVQVWTI